ncbi:MAG TPA: RHS repeat-associated core domain-containing protein, partial [Thermoanaerobaculia bacterium]|nr:RHS repeat-associated core domain-containing protein [Thermoanaerobaculia bacterium]
MPFNFPVTVNNRALALYHTKPDGSTDGVYWIGPSNLQSGSWSQTFDTTCWPTGTHTFLATATSCNRTTNSATATLEIVRKPHVDVSIVKDSSTRTAKISYQFPDNDPAGRSLNVEFLPVFPGTGVTQVIPPMQPVPDSSGTISVDVSSFGIAGILRARASNSCGETDVKDTFIDCDCHANEGDKTVGQPVRLWDGSMTYTERDPLPSEGFTLFTRNYDTNSLTDGLFGIGWRSAFDAGLAHFMDGPLDTVTIQMEGERKAAFVSSGGVWTQTWPSGLSPATLTRGSDGSWFYRDSGSSLIRIFRPDGRFGGFEDLASPTTVLIDYSTSGPPQRVYSADGTWSCTITVTGNHITAIAVDGRPDLVWQYGYAGSLLQSVTLSGSSSTWRMYEYTGGRLSAIHDAAGSLIESHAYDAKGRATSSIGAGGPDITNIEYDIAGSLPDSTITRVTYATGEQTTFEQRFISGRQQTFAVNGGCGSCGSRNSTYAVDELTGHVLRKQDARGYITSFTYDGRSRLIQERHNDRPAACDPEQDASHCRMTAAGLLAASLQSTAASTYVNYTYGDSQWPDKTTEVRKAGAISGTLIDYTSYDQGTGMPLIRTTSGWPDAANSVDRTTTVALYDGIAAAAFNPGRNFSASWLTLPQPGRKRRSVDGPQATLADITAFVYYPVDNSVPATYRGRLAAIKNAAGHITTFENYDVFGNAGRIVDPNGVATETTYDALGRALTTTVKGVPGCDASADPLCAADLTASRTYSPATGPLASQTDANGNAVTYEYDMRGRTAALSRGSSPSSLKERMEYSYDPASGKKSLERYLAMENGSWVEKRRESFSYDTLAQLTASTHADNSSIAYTYDDAGNLTSVRDENHAAANTHYSYDAAGRLASVQQTLGGSTVTTAYAYNAAGNLTNVTDPNGNITSYGYNDFGEMISQASPVTGTAMFSYGKSGELLSSTDANGATTARTYDELNRMRSSVSSRSGQAGETVSWTYDGGTFGLGRLGRMSDPAGTTDYTYDRRGSLLSESRTAGSVLLTTSFKYDANGNRTAITYPSGGTPVIYTYDYAGRVTSLSSGGVTYFSGATYLPFGPETSVTFLNGTTQTHAYDSRYRIQRNTLTGPSGPIADYTYTEDAAGNIASIHDMVDPGYNRDFAYDDLNRLTTANTGAALWGSGSYRYDAMGNMLGREIGGTVEVDPTDPLIRRGALTARPDALPAPGSVHETYAYAGTTSQLSTMTSGGIDHPITYDAAGNELRYYDPRTYSPRNLMSSITEPSEDNRSHTISYGYDGRGVRVIRWEGMTNDPVPFATRHYVYTPELQLLAVTVDDNPNVWGKTAIANVVPAMKHQYAWFNGRPVLDFVNGITLLYTFDDHLGTPILQTDATGSVAWRAEYEPYGDVWTMRTGAAGDQLLRFPGQEYVGKWEGTEERYNIFRWFRAGWGRYTQADPISFLDNAAVPVARRSAGEVLELFRYARSNPLNVTDPLGLWGIGRMAPPDESTIVCDGKGGITEHVAPEFGPKMRCIGGCTLAHEHSHAEDARAAVPNICQGQPYGRVVGFTTVQEQKESETRAYRVSLECLDARLKAGD